MHINQIINLIEHALVSAPGSFEAAANGPVEGVNWGSDRMPESWIAAILMQAAHEQGLASLPEVRIKHDVQYFESGGRALSPEDFPGLTAGGAKIDLFIGNRSSLPGLMRLRVALELKGPKSNWQQFHSDLQRLRQIQQVVSGEDQAQVFAYITCPLLNEEREKHDRDLEHSTGLKLSDFKVLESLCGSIYTGRRAYVFMHLVR
jgi:hypothetical protein